MYLAVDEGTTNVKVALYDEDFNLKLIRSARLPAFYPREGWVEQDPEEIWNTVRTLVHEIGEEHGEKIRAVGITNQRETTILWDGKSGKPVYNAIVWQCRRTAGMVEEIAEEHGREVKEKTGLEMDAYFSATKIRWILENVPLARRVLERGDLLFGTVDSYLLWKMMGIHATDHTNASRTLLYNIHRGEWDEDLLEIFGIPPEILPEIGDSFQDYGSSDTLGAEVSGIIGDQQSSLLAHGCTSHGEMKVTYGTGTFMLVNSAQELHEIRGILTTVAWSADSRRTFALEGSILSSGSVIEWLKSMGLWSDEIGEETSLFFVPAFSGLGSPYWDQRARGTIIGITQYTDRRHITRAALESMAYMVRDIAEVMGEKVKVKEIRADGGMTNNTFLMKFQADIMGVPVLVSREREMTSRGAAIAAAIGIGDASLRDIPGVEYERHNPEGDDGWREERYGRWKEAVRRSMHWSPG